MHWEGICTLNTVLRRFLSNFCLEQENPDCLFFLFSFSFSNLNLAPFPFWALIQRNKKQKQREDWHFKEWKKGLLILKLNYFLGNYNEIWSGSGEKKMIRIWRKKMIRIWICEAPIKIEIKSNSPPSFRFPLFGPLTD